MRAEHLPSADEWWRGVFPVSTLDLSRNTAPHRLIPVPRPDSTPPTRENTRAFWFPRIRGGITVIAGTLAYVALASAFGNDASFGTALVGMLGSLAAMRWVWWLEDRRAAKVDGNAGPPQRDAGTT